MIGGDSKEYEILIEACESLTSDNLFTVEIGVRQGLGSKLILENLKHKKHWHIGIDPYGNISYPHFDNKPSIVCNYTNSMKVDLLRDLNFENFTLYQLGDDEFMKSLSLLVNQLSYYWCNYKQLMVCYQNVGKIYYRKDLYQCASVFYV